MLLVTVWPVGQFWDNWRQFDAQFWSLIAIDELVIYWIAGLAHACSQSLLFKYYDLISLQFCRSSSVFDPFPSLFVQRNKVLNIVLLLKIFPENTEFVGILKNSLRKNVKNKWNHIQRYESESVSEICKMIRFATCMRSTNQHTWAVTTNLEFYFQFSFLISSFIFPGRLCEPLSSG